MKKMSSELRRTVKGGQKKQSISGHQQQREKEAAGAEMGAGFANIPVSQSPRQKAAMHPAKRVEEDDGLRFDSMAELDVYFQKKGSKE